MKELPTVIAARNGIRAIQVLSLDRVARVQNRDAVGYRFSVATTAHGEAFNIAVVFSGTTYALNTGVFDLPGVEDREERFTQFALATLGDHLDDGPIEDGEGPYITQIECFSPHFQSWRDREPATPSQIREYLRAHTYWAYEFGAGTTIYGIPDALRLGVSIEVLTREAQLYDEEEWHVRSTGTEGVSLDPHLEFIRRARDVGISEVPLRANQESPPELTVSDNERTQSQEPIVGLTYVDESRISELRLIESEKFDLTRLIAFCDELNICYRSRCYLAVAGLLRALLDHIAPLFGADSFTQAANNYQGGSTFRRNALRLDRAARDVGNLNLHRQIDHKETTPNRVQVHFANELDIVLEEVVRILG